jgi:hypothetical protein
MPEHAIQLRRAWEIPPTGGDAPARVDLPIVWDDPALVPPRLARNFRRPPLEAGRDRLVVRLDAVPGLRAVWLNDRELARPGPAADRIEVPLDAAAPGRNRLVLEIDPDGIEPGADWGRIALVIVAS